MRHLTPATRSAIVILTLAVVSYLALMGNAEAIGALIALSMMVKDRYFGDGDSNPNN